MQHLAALGYRRIAYAGGPVASWSNRERAETLRNVRAESPELDLIESGNFPPFFSGGIQAGDLAIASGATAIVAFDDLMAVGLIYRLRQHGLSVPDDISVSGFDNVRVSRLVWPNLTTVHFPRIRMGRTSVDCLLDRVLGRPPGPSRAPADSGPTRCSSIDWRPQRAAGIPRNSTRSIGSHRLPVGRAVRLTPHSV